MALRETVLNDIKTAMKSGDKARLATLRLLSAAIKQWEVDERIELDDQQVLTVLDKMVKQRRESIRHYGPAGRADLVEQEEYELSVLQVYLPEPLSDAEIEALLDQAITESGAQSLADMGKVMAVLKPQVQGRADMGALSKLVKSRLG
ncbi:MAG: GatB/YqeY domain-containing protein [Gammaproteobacteria bacterium]|nr:MAG: GatB/YqeY domain-containing protein [Gammaproteobacteria bacterium]RLA11763.1 MAG: GatB/YqeY domain-containing protein [Gammaproteobacteria bacterium]